MYPVINTLIVYLQLLGLHLGGDKEGHSLSRNSVAYPFLKVLFTQTTISLLHLPLLTNQLISPSFLPTLPPSLPLLSPSHLSQGTKYEVGDIVSVLDEGGRVYYALLRGFLEDQYAEKYAALTWLIPTTPNPMTFDPSLFVLGDRESCISV